MKKKNIKSERIVTILVLIAFIVVGTFFSNEEENQTSDNVIENTISYQISDIPEYSGQIYVEINNNIAEFTTEDMSIEEDYYSELNNGKVRNGYDQNQLGKSK